MYEPINLQDAILREVKEEKIPVDFILTGGYQIGGVITGYDSFVVVLVSDGKQYMIYKHGILTMTAMRSMKAATPQ